MAKHYEQPHSTLEMLNESSLASSLAAAKYAKRRIESHLAERPIVMVTEPGQRVPALSPVVYLKQ